MAAPPPTATTSLPVVDTDRATLEATDFAAFRPLAGLPLGMTAHVVFTAIDPVAPATTSVTMVREVIRGFIGFQGLLMSDDVSMKALVRHDRRAQPRRVCRRLRRRAPLQRRSGRDDARWPAQAPVLAGEAAKRADAALAQRVGAGRVRCRCRAQDFHADGGRRAAVVATEDRFMSAEEFDTTIEADRGTTEPAMIVDVEGFEGPLDLLLALARQQKVDLAKISILALADQYLTFIEAARKLRLELAADYLVMAAWLAYLKSRLLLPEAAPGEGPSAEDMALALAYRLRRLEAFRDVATRLMGRPQLNRDVFARGAAGADRRNQAAGMDGDAVRSAQRLCHAARAQRAVARALQEAHGVVAGRSARRARAADRTCRPTGRRIDTFLISYVVEPALAATVMASSFASALELVREGRRRNSSERVVRADLHAQARRREWKCYDA